MIRAAYFVGIGAALGAVVVAAPLLAITMGIGKGGVVASVVLANSLF